MYSRKTNILVGLLLLWAVSSYSQNSVSLSKNANFGLNLTEVIQKRLHGKSLSDSTLWLNYTTLVSPSETGLSISAEIGTGDIPEGIKIYMQAMPIKGPGLTNSGTPTGKIQLSYVPKVIIEDIRTSFTGTGTYVGHQLIVTYEIVDFSKIQPGISSVYLQFTLK